MLKIKSNHKAIKEYYSSLEMYAKQGIIHETAIKNAFQNVLVSCCKQMNYDFIEEYPYKRLDRHKARIDGAFLDSFGVPQGYWEAKDSQDDLAKEVVKKFEIGYPRDNIIFQSPDRAIIYQGSTIILDEDITSPDKLVSVLKCLFEFKTDTQMEWENAVEEFKQRIPESAELVIKLIEEERKLNPAFIKSFETFTEICRTSINPNISLDAIEEMLVQHLLTERIFRKVFENPDFINRNIIAHEIDKVITALTSRKFNRNDFLKPLDRFYNILEKQAQSIDDYSIKQTFLNTVYEKFFQGFAIKNADTMGIVYTPQPIVDFMVNSVDEILKKEFGRSLSAKNVNILDPFTGTGNFVTNIIRKINKMDLKYKYLNELHCNEIMLLPYYIASMNIEHQFYEITGEYIPFQGICLVDTFQLVESSQISMFSEENTERVEKLKQTPIFVYIGNPPYNAGQANENDNNKNRKYPILDKRVSDTFAKDSKATLKNSLSDPYVKAFRMAIDKVIENGEGIVAYVSNNSFIDGIAMDGMRKHLQENFDRIYIYNLKGNVRQNTKISGTTHNVFGIQVGVSINFLIKTKNKLEANLGIKYYEINDFLRKEERYKLLEKAKNIYGVDWKEIIPDKNHVWLTEGMEDDWDSNFAMFNESKTLFYDKSNGVNSGRDVWIYNSQINTLTRNIKNTLAEYNRQLFLYNAEDCPPDIDNFVEYDESKISWSSTLKGKLKQQKNISFHTNKIKLTLYRPFYKQYTYYEEDFIDRRGRFWYYYPKSTTGNENRTICVSGVGSNKPFQSLIVNFIPCLDMLEKTQCFPFYTYNEDGTNRKENISDWALMVFRDRYSVVGGQGAVAGGQGSDSNNFINIDEVQNAKNKNIQGFGGLAESDGFSGDCLSNFGEISQERNVWSGESNSEGSSFSPIEYSRGKSEKHNKGIHSISQDSEGFISRTGNAVDNSSSPELSNEGGNDSNMAIDTNNRETSQRSNSLIESQTYQPQTTDHRPLITKWDIFYYIYGVLHKPEYREKYAANLKRELPRIPFYGVQGSVDGVQETGIIDDEINTFYKYINNGKIDSVSNCKSAFNFLQNLFIKNNLKLTTDPQPPTTDHQPLTTDLPFWYISLAGRILADLHINYESQEEYYLEKIEAPGKQLDFRVEKMKYNKDKTAIIYNDFLTLSGIPIEAHNYKLGNRSALDWIIDQYQVKTDKRSGITNDPNRLEEPDYIIKLIGKIVRVSLETVRIVESLRG